MREILECNRASIFSGGIFFENGHCALFRGEGKCRSNLRKETVYFSYTLNASLYC